MRAALSVLCIVVLLAGAVWLCWLGASQLYSARASTSWPSVTGTVVSAGFKGTGSGQNYARKAYVQYRYTIDGNNYAGERIAFGPTPNFKVDGVVEGARNEAIKELARQTGGSDVAVYYDPDAPANAVLLPGGGLFFLLHIFGSALLVGMAGLIFLITTGRTKVPVYRR